MAPYRNQLTTIKRISSRTTSTVYLCQEKKTKSFVVLKEIKFTSGVTSIGDDPHQEYKVARLLAQVGGHLHLLCYRSTRIENGSLYLLMECCDQDDLYSYLEKQEDRRLDEDLARHFFRQIAMGVQFLHQHGVAHRDISLENVLLGDKYATKLCDFGLSAIFNAKRHEKLYCTGRVGKAYYMAPEVVADTAYDPIRADIWSLGILLFILLTGSPLFETVTPQDLAFNALDSTIDLMTKLIQIQPENRFASVDEILQTMDAQDRADQQE
ncbi:Camk protein kinase, partial [Globisporangium splendens]